jgi:ABC-type multidrug transport system ATPase subunit
VTATVEIERVSKHYGKIEAVREVSFVLAPGQTVALVGHNGAGKTTLLKLMLGLVRPTSGTIRVLDEDPAAGEFAARSKVGFLPENVSFNPALTGREILSSICVSSARLRIRRSSCWSGSVLARHRRVASGPIRKGCASGSVSLKR